MKSVSTFNFSFIILKLECMLPLLISLDSIINLCGGCPGSSVCVDFSRVLKMSAKSRMYNFIRSLVSVGRFEVQKLNFVASYCYP